MKYSVVNEGEHDSCDNKCAFPHLVLSNLNPAGEEEKKAEVVSAMSQTSTAAGSSTSRFLHLSRVKQKTTTEEEKTHMGKCLNIHTRHGLGCFGAMAFGVGVLRGTEVEGGWVCYTYISNTILHMNCSFTYLFFTAYASLFNSAIM